MSEIRNFKISATHLGYESHGIFTAYLTLQSAGFGISVGGYALDEFIDKKRIITKKRR